MIRIVGTALYQWDTGRYATTDIEADHIHFSNKGDSKAVIMELADSQAKIPDYLLQTGKQLCVYVVRNGITVESVVFSVNQRERPESYVYDEDQRNFVYVLIESAEAATKAANQGAAVATKAAQNANAATNAANTATNTANNAAQNANDAANNANKAAIKVAQAAKSLMVVGKAEGTVIHLDDAIDQYLVGLRVFGKTTQNGTPTPDAPVDIESGGKSGKVGVSIEGKNLLDLNAATFLGCINNGGVLVSNVNNAHYAALVCPGLVDTFMACKGKTVIFSANKSIGGRAMAVVIYGKMKSGDPYQSINGKVGERFVSFQIAEDFENITSVELRWNRSVSGAFTDTTSSITDLQVEIGDIATTYEPYRGQTITIETPNGLPGIPVSSGGNYTDASGQQWICDEIDFAKGVYVHRTKSGNLYDYVDRYCAPIDNTQYSENVLRFDFGNVFDSKVHTKALCNRFAFRFAHGVDIADVRVQEGVSTHSTGDFISVFIDKSRLFSANVVGFKTYLQNNATIVLCAINAPIETPLSQEELAAYASLHTYKNNTTVSNDAGAWMELEYVMDARKYIDNMILGTIFPATVE